MVNYLKKLGIGHVLEDSSGNAGASIAAYCAAADIACDIMRSGFDIGGKLFQIEMWRAAG